jgi:hypothetical protein
MRRESRYFYFASTTRFKQFKNDLIKILFSEYVIIEDGLPIDPATTRIISNAVEPQAKIEFEAFQFKKFTDVAISVKCEILLCELGDCYIYDQTTTI